MKRKQLALILGIIAMAIVLIVAIVKLNSNERPENEKSEENITDQIKGIPLSTLPPEAFEIQDNTITDTWGVVLKYDQLPKELQDAESYTITIGEVVYDLTINKYNDNVYNGQVSSVEHTEEEVGEGLINKN